LDGRHRRQCREPVGHQRRPLRRSSPERRGRPVQPRDRNRVRGVVDAIDAGAGTITLKANLGLALAPGDQVHLMAAQGQIPVGSTTKEANAPTVFATNEGPALLELDGTAACRINLVAGEYS